jgi:protein SCO1/2
MPRVPHKFTRNLALLVASAAFFVGVAARGQYRADLPSDGVPIAGPNPEVVEKPNAILPADLEFTRSSDGKKIKLGELFDQKKPVVLQLVYFSCPFLCGVSQETLVSAMRGGLRDLQVGQDYDIVVVSIDPDDTPATAEAKREKYLALAGKTPDQKGFTYLTGSQDNIQVLADTIGFGFKRNFGAAPDDPAGKFAHSAGTFICTPAGRLSQTIRGVNYPNDTLHFALVQASSGKIGHGFLETIALPCGAMRLNPLTGRYEQNPWFWAGAAGGGATFAFMGVFLAFMWRGELKRKRAGTDQAAIDANGPMDPANQEGGA